MCRILLIDDDTDILDVYTDALKVSDITTKSASSRKEALTILQWYSPDVIILDYCFPDAMGDTLFKALPRHRAEVIVATGLEAATEPKFRARLLDMGAAYVMQKPVDIEELRAVVRKATRYRHALDILRSTEDYSSGLLLEQLTKSVAVLEETRKAMNGRTQPA